MSSQDEGRDQGRVAGAGLAGRAPTPDPEDTCRSLCRLVVPAVADLAVIYTVDGDTLVRSGSASANPTISATADSLFGNLSVALATNHPLARIVKGRQPLALDDITPENMAA